MRDWTTAAAGTKINGGAFTVPDALGGKTLHPYGDFLLHDVGTGDGIGIPVVEHYGRMAARMPKECPPEAFQHTLNRVRTPPLGGVRVRPRIMHDGATLTFTDAIRRHRGEGDHAGEYVPQVGARRSGIRS